MSDDKITKIKIVNEKRGPLISDRTGAILVLLALAVVVIIATCWPGGAP